MSLPPLAIVQARMGSARLPGKMLLPLAGKPLWWHAWNAAVKAFGRENVMVAMPTNEENDELAQSCNEFGASVFRWNGPEDDVLGRFHACAHLVRWHPDTVIVRVTPDDPRKDPEIMRNCAAGYRTSVELGGEAFTLAMLDDAQAYLDPFDLAEGWPDGFPAPQPHPDDLAAREHITHAIFDTPPPPPPEGVWTVDTPEDYQAMKKVMEG